MACFGDSTLVLEVPEASAFGLSVVVEKAVVGSAFGLSVEGLVVRRLWEEKEEETATMATMARVRIIRTQINKLKKKRHGQSLSQHPIPHQHQTFPNHPQR